MDSQDIEIPIEDGGRTSHLAVRVTRPAAAEADPLCVLYLHGFRSSQDGDKATFFRRHLVDRGLPVATFDFQGHGASGGELRSLTLSRNLSDLGRVHGLLRSEGYTRFLLFGSSMGAATALWYAALHPDDFVAAVHISPAVSMEESLLARVGRDGEAIWQRDGSLPFPHDKGPVVLDWGLIEDLRSFGSERLAKLYSTPTLIFQGRRDASVDWRTVLDLADRVGGGMIVHLMMDGDHRLVDRLDHLWATTEAYLEGVA